MQQASWDDFYGVVFTQLSYHSIGHATKDANYEPRLTQAFFKN